MKVSVIIPNYNHEKFLKQRIESVLNQTFEDFEVIILDDFSKDKSKDVISSFASNSHVTHIIYNEKNSGSPFIQWEKGIELAKGEYIWIAESDDFAEIDFLEKMVPVLEENKNLVLVYCDSNIVNQNNVIKHRSSEDKAEWLKTNRWLESYQEDGNTEVINYLGYDCTINNTSAVLFRKSAILNSLPFDQDFRYVGDWYFFLKVVRNNQIAYISEPLNYFRFHDNHWSRNDSNNLIFVVEYFKVYNYLLKNYSFKDKHKLYNAFYRYTRHYGLTKKKMTWTKYKEIIKINRCLFLKMIKYNLIENLKYKLNRNNK